MVGPELGEFPLASKMDGKPVLLTIKEGAWLCGGDFYFFVVARGGFLVTSKSKALGFWWKIVG